MKINYKYLIISVLLIGLNSHSQIKQHGSVSWYNPEKIGVEVLELVTGSHTLYSNGAVTILDSFRIEPFDSLRVLAPLANVFKIGGTWWATAPGSQEVYVVDTLLRSIKRHDRTYYRGYNFAAYQFVHRDTLFSFGGTGFWSSNSHLTYYDFESREWNLYSTAPFLLNTDVMGHGYIALDSYSLEDQSLFAYSESEVYAFQFKTGVWEKLGLHGINGNDFSRATVDLGDGRIYMHYLGDLVELDPKQNTIRAVAAKNGSNFFVNRKKEYLHFAYVHEDQLVNLRFNSAGNVEAPVIDITPLELPSHKVIRPLYTPAWRPVFINLSLGITAALLLFWLLWKLAGRNKGAVSYARASLQEEQLQLLRDLMEGPMNTDELNTALGMGKGTLDSQRKKRSDFIKAINDLGEALYQAQIIDRYKDSVDKRVVYYRINPGVRRHILKLLGQ
jgi:hypothetical protein